MNLLHLVAIRRTPISESVRKSDSNPGSLLLVKEPKLKGSRALGVGGGVH